MKKILAMGIGIIALSLLACSTGLVTADQGGEYTVIDAALSPVEGDDVYSIPPGSVIYHSADGITTVYAPDGKIVLKARDSDAARIATTMGMKPVTYSVEVPNGSLCIHEPINFYTEDRGWITGNGTKTYAPDGTLVVTVMTEKRKTEDETAGIQPKDFPEGCWVEFAADHIWSLWKKLWEFTAYWECPRSPPEPHSNTVNLLFNAVQDYSEPGDCTANVRVEQLAWAS